MKGVRNNNFRLLAVFSVIVLSAQIAFSAPYNPPCNSAVGGVKICGLCYDCDASVSDGICPEHFGKDCSPITDIDCAYGYIYGTIEDSAGSPLESAQVEVVNPGVPAGFYVSSANALGEYNLSVPGGFYYDIIASKPSYEPEVDNSSVAIDEHVNVDFVLESSSTLCKADCTSVNNLCDADCDFEGGCRFSTPLAKSLCDGKPKGFALDAGGSEIVCCKGETSTYQSAVQPRLVADVENTLTTMIPALLGGKRVRVVVAVMEK